MTLTARCCSNVARLLSTSCHRPSTSSNLIHTSSCFLTGICYRASATTINRRISSNSETTTDQDCNSADTTRNADFSKQFKNLLPSEDWLRALNKDDRTTYETIKNEIEVYVYMNKHAPTTLTPEHWNKLLRLIKIGERVDYLNYLTKVEYLVSKRNRKIVRKDNTIELHFAKEQEKFDRGEMGYGPGMYQLVNNPMRRKQRVLGAQGSRVVASMRTGVPKLAIDMQYLHSETARSQSVLGKQAMYMISQNFEFSTPFPMTFVNMNAESGPGFFEKSVGFYSGSYQHQTVLPDFTTNSVQKTFPADKKIVYISKHARDVLDGPLDADVYTICLSMDGRRESIGAARRARIRSVRLPIQRYIAWQQGPMYVPFPNLLRIFNEVYLSGGDWKTALLNNISKRHLEALEERSTIRGVHTNRRKQKIRERDEMVRMIGEATGNE